MFSDLKAPWLRLSRSDGFVCRADCYGGLNTLRLWGAEICGLLWLTGIRTGGYRLRWGAPRNRRLTSEFCTVKCCSGYGNWTSHDVILIACLPAG